MYENREIEDIKSKYKKIWNYEEMLCPLISFDFGGYFPLKRFEKLREIKNKQNFDVNSIKPSNFMGDYENLFKMNKKFKKIDGDLFKGFSPLPSIPWMEAILKCPLKISEDGIWALERKADWEELEQLDSSLQENSWFKKYFNFLESLVLHSRGRYPVGQPILRGVSDLLGVIRGHTQALFDCIDSPDNVKQLTKQIANIMITVFKKQFEIIEPFHGGYFIPQYSIWAPGPIVRLQEDATAVYSPDIYNKFIKPLDRFIASSFSYTLIHLHSSSLFLLDSFLDIEEIDLFQINKDVKGMPVKDMIPYLKKVQNKKRPLLIRGSLNKKDLNLLGENLSPTGLILQIVIDEPKQAKNIIQYLKKSALKNH